MATSIPETQAVVYSDGTPSYITYSWTITRLNTKKENGFENAVIQTYWKLVGVDTQNKVAQFDGATPFSTAGQTEFVEFQNLQEADVLSWIQEQVVGSYADHIMQQIFKDLDTQHNVIHSASLPWAPPEEPSNPETPQ